MVLFGHLRPVDTVNLNSISDKIVTTICNGEVLETVDQAKAYGEAHEGAVSASPVRDSYCRRSESERAYCKSARAIICSHSTLRMPTQVMVHRLPFCHDFFHVTGLQDDLSRFFSNSLSELLISKKMNYLFSQVSVVHLLVH